ncbi:MAG: hypothetical protein ACLU9X_13555 [Alistipes shahii]
MKRLVTLLAALAALQTYAQRIEATLPSPDAKSLGMGGVMMTTLSGSHAIYNNSATAIFSHTPSQVSSSYYGQRSFDYYAVSGFCRFDNINLVQAGWRQFLREHGNNDMAVDLGYARRIGDPVGRRHRRPLHAPQTPRHLSRRAGRGFERRVAAAAGERRQLLDAARRRQAGQSGRVSPRYGIHPADGFHRGRGPRHVPHRCARNHGRN